jgi:hypothetical protein
VKIDHRDLNIYLKTEYTCIILTYLFTGLPGTGILISSVTIVKNRGKYVYYTPS